MEKYTKAQMEVIEFEAEDVITTSSMGNHTFAMAFSSSPSTTQTIFLKLLQHIP